MDTRPTPAVYAPLPRALHWLMAALILVLLAMGLYMTSLPEGDARWAWYTPHKSLGMIAFLLLLVRLARRLWGPPPPPLPAHTPAWERAAAHLTHALLYALMLLLPFAPREPGNAPLRAIPARSRQFSGFVRSKFGAATS